MAIKRFFYTICTVLLFSGSVFAGDFTENGNGTVSDATTGLMWQQSDDDTKRQWQAALDYCNELSLAGYSNWRLPDVKELESIVDEMKSYPAIDEISFPGTNNYSYYSSSSHVEFTDEAWRVNFYDGEVYLGEKTIVNYVRCVR